MFAACCKLLLRGKRSGSAVISRENQLRKAFTFALFLCVTAIVEAHVLVIMQDTVVQRANMMK